MASKSKEDHAFLWIATTGSVLVSVGVWWGYRRIAQHRRERLPPHSKTGYAQTLSILNTKEAPWWMLEQSRMYKGNIYRMSVLVPGLHTIVIGDAAVARTILQQPQVKPYLVYSGFNRVLGGWNIVTSNGYAWKHARKATAIAFSRPSLERMAAATQQHLTQWLHPIHKSSAINLDISKEMVQLTTSSIAQAALEYPITTQEVDQFHHDLEVALIEYLRTQVGNPLRLLLGWFIPSVQQANQAARRLRELSARILAHYRQSGDTSTKRPSLIQCIARNPNYTSDAQRISDITTFLVAGHDTTAYSIAWTMIELARHPQIQTQLRQQLQASSNGNHVDLLHQVIKESLRLHPVAAMGAVRTVTQAIQVPNQTYGIPKGSTVFVHLLSIHRNPAHVGDHPDEFIPSRWQPNPNVPNDSERMRLLEMAYMPFVLGTRNCIGQGLATRNVTGVVERLVTELQWSLAEEGTTDHFLTLKPAGVILRAEPIGVP